MNRKTISATTMLDYRAFDLERRRRLILRILDFQTHMKTVPDETLKQLNDALVDTDRSLDWTERIKKRVLE